MGKKYQQVTPQVDSRWRLGTTATLATLVLFLTVYLPLAGQGFVRDDYAWILQSRVTSPDDLVGLLSRDIGFYRPMVGLTFAVNEWFFGVRPWGYGLTNVLLALGCAVSIVALGRAMGLPRGGALVAGALWLLHAEFLPIGVLWISGRTALVMILAATASAAALLGGRFWLALAWLAVALFSKEEAVVLPFVLLGWLIIRPSAIRPLAWAMGAGTLVVIYLIARTFAGATNPANAPAFYRLTFEPAIVVDNAGLVRHTRRMDRGDCRGARRAGVARKAGAHRRPPGARAQLHPDVQRALDRRIVRSHHLDSGSIRPVPGSAGGRRLPRGGGLLHTALETRVTRPSTRGARRGDRLRRGDGARAPPGCTRVGDENRVRRRR